MSQVSLNTTPNVGQNLENTPRDTQVRVGNLGGHQVVLATAGQDKIDEATIRNVITAIHDTEGVREEQYIQAKANLENLIKVAPSLSQRDVEQVITSAISAVLYELKPQESLQRLEEFSKVMLSNALHKVDDTMLPEDLSRVGREEVRSFVNDNTETTTSPINQAEQNHEASQTTKIIDDARKDLDTFKSRFGGTPHFPDGKPTYAQSSSKFCGVPIESCQAWCQEKINSSTHLKGFWSCIGSLFGVSDTPQTTFERSALYIESMKLLSENKEVISAALRNNSDKGALLMGTLTRLACHVGDNGGPEGMIRNIQDGLDMFTHLYQEAKRNNTLEDFFNALDGVCFEDRMSKLQTYALAHQDEADSIGAGDNVQSGLLTVKLEHVADHKPNDTMLETLIKELGAICLSHPELELNWDDHIYPHLVSTTLGMNRQVIGEDGNPSFNEDRTPMFAPITSADIDRLHSALNDMFFFDPE